MRVFSGLTAPYPTWAIRPTRPTKILLSCGLLASLVCTAMGGCFQQPEESRIVATVNGKPISQSEFDYRWSELSDAARTRYDRQGGKKKFLDDLISREVLLQEARRQGLDQSLALRERMERVKEQLILDELMKDAASRPVEISDAELEAYYQSHDDMLLAARQIRGAQIVMANVFQAKDLKHQISQGWNFSKLAQRYSLDEKTKADGGEFNFSRKGMLDPAIEQFLLTQKAGAVSDPVETAAGFHLVKVISRDPDETKHLEAVRQQLKRELYAEKRRKQVEEVLAKLRSSATIRMAAGSELLTQDVGSLAGRTP